jgi:hypothetical protein
MYAPMVLIAAILQERFYDLLELDIDRDGFLSEHELEAYIADILESTTSLTPLMLRFHAVYHTRKIMFYAKSSKKGTLVIY